MREAEGAFEIGFSEMDPQSDVMEGISKFLMA